MERVLFFVASILATGHAQVITLGQCSPTVQAMANFSAADYLGEWFEIAKTPTEFQEDGECSAANYSLNLDGTVAVLNTMVVDNFLSSAEATAVVSSTDGSAQLTVNFGGPIDSPYWILDTDYTTFSLVYSCTDINETQRSISVWKLSRTKTLEAVTSAYMDAVVDNIDGISSEDLTVTDQSDVACYVLPELNSGDPVILSGLCDRNISAVANFDAARYIGVWRTIETYYSANSAGDCGTAQYDLNIQGTVDVLNSQVVDQTLVTFAGTASVVSTDGSGVLSVFFPTVNMEMELLIIDTDYDNYSLAYACSDLTDDTFQVFAFKLSRTRELSEAAIDAIAQASSNIPVLNDRFYYEVDQTDAACFYYPEANGLPVTFPGQCEENIQTVQGFLAADYLGTWYDAASYPSTFQGGNCKTAYYSLNANGNIDVYNTQVLNGYVDTINGAAVLDSTDGSAKLLVTFPTGIDGVDVTVPYWVLATDYNSYSLVYTCVNLNTEQRQVWSWKLSRATSLTAAAVTAIAAVVDTVDVLDERYFVDSDHTDEGCRLTAAGDPVIMPGQCDESLEVAQANFNIDLFSGTWYEVERYETDGRGSTCNINEYTFVEDNVFDLFTSQVVDQAFVTETISGYVNSTDGSGKLVLSRPLLDDSGGIAVVTFIDTPYWIISTDYDNYALAYTCENLNAAQKRIYSWKLSRSRELDAASNAAIAQAITTVPDLNPDYYVAIDLSVDGCFYFPEANGQPVVYPGQCGTNIAAVANFNAALYTGTWYEIESYPSVFQSGTCAIAEYTLNALGTVDVLNTQVINEELVSVIGTAEVASTDGSGVLLVTFPIEGTNLNQSLEYWVLATDYTDFALVYACNNINDEQRAVWSWKLSRSQTLSAAANTAINNVINNIDVLDERYYEVQDHTEGGCFYHPELYEDGVVIFRGQCNEDIPVVENFDAERYLGTWYDISSYPSDFVYGDCPTAEYSLNAAGTVDVYNTQVINQTLDTISGTAVVTSTDGSAKLTVYFPNAPAEGFPYWVLSTDYTTYSLVYSCVNVGANNRAVYSWKMSRTRELLFVGNAYIDLVVESINVLDDRYYVNRDLSDDGCFYYPEPTGSGPVLFPGNCNINIPVQMDFDLNRYAGTWNEIEGYGSEFQSGTCPIARYSLNEAGYVDVVNSQVINQTLDTMTAQAYAVSDDGSARFIVHFPMSGSEVGVTAIMSYWVLATDYDNYALVYSCENLGIYYRRVWSWKLSRDKTLSAAATTAIANAISTVEVLDDRYYVSAAVTDDDCFYYPEVTGAPVVFPGQCEETIQTVQNFSPADYLGEWYDTSSYPSTFQGGNCRTAYYSLNANGNIDVYNTQIISGYLDTVNGTAVLDSTDGSAKLLVTFPTGIEGVDVTVPYWVLATDYTSYSLVYSCINLNTEEKQVWSWKLSRDITLTTAAEAAITAVIDTVDVLDDRYYVDSDNTDEGCRLAGAGDPVIMPGQCDDTLEAQADFSIDLFSGTWYEIEKYADDGSDGTCNTNEFTLAANNFFDVIVTEVVNQTLVSETKSGSFQSTDGSGKLVFTILETEDTDGIAIGTFRTTPYWIMSTDYTNYALAYSCENLNPDQKRIYSWKLSRSKELNAAANAAIAETIASVPDLNPDFYAVTDLTDAACFYFPEVNGEPVTFPGQCGTNIAAVANFNAELYTGTWYEIESYPSVFESGTCATAEYTLNALGTVDVLNSQVINNELLTVSGTAEVASTDGSGVLLVTFPIEGTNLNQSLEYWVLATDYTDFALVYACNNINDDQRTVWSWKLSRTQTLSAAANTAINNVINNIEVLDERYFETQDHSEDGCFYYPEISDGSLAIFPGQCNEDIAAVEDFDAARYLGTWYDVASYTSDFVYGDCPTAEYSLNAAGTVDVYNTQVINQTLDTISGTAVVTSTDGSAKLTVYFPNAPAEGFPYWVLATDYDSYSLVYSCVNVDANSRAVYSWKLSRGRALANAAIAAIDEVITSINVLDDRYYVNRDLSDDGCFYYPEPTGSGPVLFPGNCDITIPAQMDFDPSRYAGTWNEIEGYGSEFQFGTCPIAQYTLNEDGFVDVVNSQVINQTLATISGQAYVDSTDGSAKLVVLFPSTESGVTVNAVMSYWVLATDYDSYALVYSCENVDDNNKRVWSWKLSRDKTLSAAATTAIANAMSTVNVLDDRYYVSAALTDDDCFYYPEVTGAPVVFPGQCEETIQTVQNFSPADYLGEWYDTSSYPSTFQGGDCRTAYYSLNANGNIDVYNTQVISGYLDTINGTAVLDSTDGSAKLLVTFPTGIEGVDVTVPYWVLATDYNSYSLVYSCVNLNTEQRQVWSWKLSRDASLTAAADTAITAVVATVDVLDERYFVDSDNTEEGCRLTQAGDPIIMPGQCDESLEAQADFNLELFSGTWYEIEKYAVDGSDGTCNTNEFTLTANNFFDVVTTEVVNQSLVTEAITGSYNSTEGSGKLVFTTLETDDSGGITIASFRHTPYWIMSTDYDNYALAYSCENLNAEQKRIYSWKLSRSKELDAAANAAIAETIASVPDLGPDFYVPTDLTDDACFYFPEVNGEPVTFPGQCGTNIAAVANFNAALYTGTWYEIESYPSVYEGGTCATAEYTLNDLGTVDVLNTQVINEELVSVIGTAEVASTDGSGVLLVTFPIEGTNLTQSLEYWVLATDYTDFALVYACNNINEDQRTVWSWKLSRSQTLSAAANTAINNVINNIEVLDERYYETQDHSEDGCFYHPDISDGDLVIFSGQCNEDIQVVEDFDAERYLGTWYDIASYTSDFVYGDCPTAEYSLNAAGTVDVYNTQIVNQTLDTINGTAAVTSTDGSAKLTVYFPNAPAEGFPYWVLATDYDSYSLVYSCVNLDANSRAVYSWKLSRRRELANLASAAMDEVISSINVLDDRYYVNRDLSDDGCFYYPEPTGSGPVLFAGNCDTTIPVQMDFDPSRYAGTWNEIEGYGSEFQFGTCPIAQYTLNEDGFVDVVNSQVINQTLATMSGQAYVDSTDGSAKLVVLFPSTDSQVTVTAVMSYWVLATDYDSYALVYSCENLDDNNKNVWSWKLSRDKTLSAAATTAIANAMSTVNVLDDRYYISAAVTDDDCFYFPEAVSGEPVIFPGQCEDTVTPIADFNQVSFAGDWYEISSYPKAYGPSGTCGSSSWTQTASGYDLSVSQVVNQWLETRNGTVVPAADGTGRLTVTLDLNELGITTAEDVLIMATDYTSYALTYSCVNIDENYRRVVSTKLSRSDTLSAAANTAIDAVINSIQVLEDRYYEESGRTEADCFFYPDNNGGPVVLAGQCPSDDEVNVVTEFDAARYLGLWHEIERYPSDFQTGQCANAFYDLNNAGTVDVTNSLVNNERLDVSYGTAEVATTDGRGILTVTFPNEVTGVDNVLNYYILDTDYDTYSLVYSCLNLDAETKRIFSWKLSRNQEGLTEEAETAITAIVSNFTDLYDGYYQTTSQDSDSCFYYPELTAGSNVILPGTCDTRISAMANFDADRYTGRWFEIARYPQSFEIGECAIARYSLNPNGVVDVVNSIVYNQQLEVVIGFASIMSTDGSGLLNVSLPIFGTDQFQNANYYVLETDYDNFALVYSCRDLEDGNRQVSSWKLSRERTLAAEYDNIIDPIIVSTQGLLEDYYIYTDQSDEACFFVPEFDPQSAVAFPGQCNEDTVPVVDNFNINNFLGVWNEIEHYPSGYNTGDCLSSNYQLANGQYIVTNVSVTGLEATINDNQFTVSANGRLTKTLANGEVIDYFVLATDYNTYSLLYSCMNIDDEFRLVWSAKLSRTRELTALANTAINQVVDSYEVLRSDFYLPVDQSDDSCFYYPTLTSGESVVIPGQCETAINAVTQFDISEFLGRWYEIEAYPQDYETGSCVSAYYMYDPDTGNVTLNILHVLDGEDIQFTRSAVLSDPTTGVFTEADGTTTVVLATNYEDYALLYSCSNVDAVSRKISAWKMSRTRTMSMIGTASINLQISNREELHQPYFVTTSQSEDCPEVSSAHLVTSSILVLVIAAVINYFV